MSALVIVGVAVVAAAILFVLLRGKSSSSSASSSAPVALTQTYAPWKLQHRENVNHNTVLFRFALPQPNMRVGLPIGKHILLRKPGENWSRAYTPISSDDELGYVDFLVKLYPTGKMSQVLAELKVGESIEFRGPQGHLEYLGQGEITISRKGEKDTKVYNNIGMISGGSGITPMLQVLRAITKHAGSDHTKASLIYANVTPQDILLKKELDHENEAFENIKVFYTLDKPEAGWTGGSGHVTRDMIKEHLPAPADDCLIMLCGPPIMVKIMTENLLALGYTEEMIFSF